MKKSAWLRERERRLEAFVKAPSIRVLGIKAGRINLRGLGPLDAHFDATRDQFYVNLPAPFAHIRLYEVMRPTLGDWAEIHAALVSLGVLVISGE